MGIGKVVRAAKAALGTLGSDYNGPTIDAGAVPKAKQKVGFPQKTVKVRGVLSRESCKGTRQGATHRVNKPGTGGASRKMRRNSVED